MPEESQAVKHSRFSENIPVRDAAGVRDEMTHQCEAISIADKAWTTYFIAPYCGAYEWALAQFQKALKDQEKADQTERELAFIALSLATGNAMLGMFIAGGQQALISKVGDRALKGKFLSSQITRFARANGRNKAIAKYMLDQAADIVKGTAVDQAKKHWVDGVDAPIGNEIGPTELSGMFTTFVGNLVLQAKEQLRITAETPVDKVFTLQEKVRRLRSIKDAGFLREHPSSGYLPGSEVLKAKLLLAFFMKFVLDQDYLLTADMNMLKYGTDAYLASETRRSNPAPPSDGITQTTRSNEQTWVGYTAVGYEVVEAINAAYKACKEHQTIPSDEDDFFEPYAAYNPDVTKLDRELNAKLLLKAERVLERLDLVPPLFAGSL